MVITSEGAIWQGAQIGEEGDADAFGHRHKANVGEALAERAEARGPASRRVASELTYDLRSGEPDTLDSMVAIDVRERRDGPDRATAIGGRMVAIRDGKYAHVSLPTRPRPRAASTSPSNYNVERFRPRYDGRLGDPMLLRRRS